MSLHKEGLVQMPRGSTGRLLKGGFSPRTKSSNLCPDWSAGRFAYFCCVLFFNRSLKRWAAVTRLVRKVHPTGQPSFQQPPGWYRQKAVSPKQSLLLGQVILTFKFKWCHGQAQASTVLVGLAGPILSIHLINS